MDDKTLREICEETGISRRAIQGYEEMGLVSATRKNERGYLLYNAEMEERIRQIKLFQEMRFSVKEIKDIIDAPKQELVSALENQIEKMKNEVEHIEKLIEVAEKIINQF